MVLLFTLKNVKTSKQKPQEIITICCDWLFITTSGVNSTKSEIQLRSVICILAF